MSRHRISSCWVALAVTAACGGGSGADTEQSSAPANEQLLLKGHAVFGHEVRTIRPCGGEETLWAIDSTGLLWDLYKELAPGVEPYEEIFVIVLGAAGQAPLDGFGADYTGAFIVERVLYAAGEGFGCDLDLDGFQFRLSGNEPFWNLRISDGGAELDRMGAPSAAWTDVRSQQTEAGIKYMAHHDDAGTLDVSIVAEPCRDSMSGAFYGYRSEVIVSGERLQGCALRGAAWFGTGG